MTLFFLTQYRFSDFTEPDGVNCMIVRAKSKTEARWLAKNDEMDNRGNCVWDENHAECNAITDSGEAKVLLVS